MRKKDVKIIDIEKVSHKDASYNSYKICVSNNDYYNVLNDWFWPIGTMCKPWRSRRINNFYDDHSSNYQFENNENSELDSLSDYNGNDEWDEESYYKYHY